MELFFDLSADCGETLEYKANNLRSDFLDNWMLSS